MKYLTIAVDGASKGNPGAAGIGVVVYNEAGEVVKEIGEYIGMTTNNVAEYTGLIRGLEEALKLGAESIRIQTDSELLVKQIAGIYKVKAPHLAEMYHEARLLLSKFQDAQIGHVPRGQNAHADRLASDAARRRADYVPGGPAKAKSRAARGGPSTPKPRSEPPRQSGGGQMNLDM